jgi:IS5 family transposase
MFAIGIAVVLVVAAIGGLAAQVRMGPEEMALLRLARVATAQRRLVASAAQRDDGDRINAVLAAAGYNFSLLLRWLEEPLCVLSLILWRALLATPLHLTLCRKTFFTADYVEP